MPIAVREFPNGRPIRGCRCRRLYAVSSRAEPAAGNEAGTHSVSWQGENEVRSHLVNLLDYNKYHLTDFLEQEHEKDCS